MPFDHLTSRGVGINYRSDIAADIWKEIDKIDFLEVYTEKFFIKDDDPLLQKIITQVPLVLHGLDLSIGSTETIDADYQRKITHVLNEQKYEWFSDHLSLTQQSGVEVGHLMPIQFSEAVVETVVDKIKIIASLSKQPFLLENITYYYPIPGGDLTETQFISTILEKADCGMLLDVNNLYINSINHRYDPREYLKQIPLDRVVELHVAGGSYKFDMLVDTHANAVWKEVWELLDDVLKITPAKGIIIERDANLNHYRELLDEVEIARGIFNKRR